MGCHSNGTLCTLAYMCPGVLCTPRERRHLTIATINERTRRETGSYEDAAISTKTEKEPTCEMQVQRYRRNHSMRVGLGERRCGERSDDLWPR